MIEDKKNGFVVNPKNTDELVSVVRQFLHLSWEEKRSMGVAGRKKVEDEFDRMIVVNAYRESLKSLST